MAINDVIGLEFDDKCIPNGINDLGVHVDIYVCFYVIHALLVSGFTRVLSRVEC